MQTRQTPSIRRITLFLAALALFGVETAACSGDDAPPTNTDPRLGREKKVRFASGCSTSVVMPVGAEERVTVVSAEENGTLPEDLTPASTDPTVIAVNPGPEPFQIEMKALAKGSTNIEVRTGGARYDWLTFSVEPAKAVKFQAEPAVLAGGRLGVGVMEVYGACATDACPLFGHSFLQWSVEPSAALVLLKDELGIAHFTGGAVGGSEILGKEPSEGASLVKQAVEVVDTATITGLAGQLALIPSMSDAEAPQPVPLPAKVTASTSFTIRLEGLRAGKTPVAISRHDIVWTTPPEITLVPQNEPADTVAEVFNSGSTPGDFTLTAKVDLLGGMEQSFIVTVMPAM